MPHRVDAGGEIGRGAALLVHHADLDGVARQPEQILHRIEQAISEGAFLGAVHLRLDHVDRPGRAVAAGAIAAHVVRSDQAHDDRVDDAFRRLAAVRQEQAGVVIRWPTVRTNSSDRPGSTRVPPSSVV